MVLSKGSPVEPLTHDDVAAFIEQASSELAGADKRVLAIIPDGTRTSQLPLLFRLLCTHLGPRVQQLDFLIALGTHQPMSAEAISRLVESRVNEDGEVKEYPHVHIFNHQWANPQTLQTIGTISREEASELTGGLLVDEIPVTLNRMI